MLLVRLINITSNKNYDGPDLTCEKQRLPIRDFPKNWEILFAPKSKVSHLYHFIDSN